MTDAGPALPPAALMVRHPVADFDSWKKGFDDHEGARKEAGILGHHLNRSRDDPNDVSIYMAVSDITRARAFADSAELAQAMQDVGVTGPPEITWMTPLRESVQWEGEHPAFLISHAVEDFDRWLDGYDGAADLQRARGIIGHAANRSLDDPSVAIVYHQADSFETLEAFLANADLQAAMAEAGVAGPPEVSFHTGGWAKLY